LSQGLIRESDMAGEIGEVINTLSLHDVSLITVKKVEFLAIGMALDNRPGGSKISLFKAVDRTLRSLGAEPFSEASREALSKLS
jgi:hypothetical protein